MTEIYKVFCPCCGKTFGERATRKLPARRPGTKPYQTLGTRFYTDTIDWDANKRFGCIMHTEGRGTLDFVRYFDPDEQPEWFDKTKARLLAALGEWIAKGWITAEEVGAGIWPTTAPALGRAKTKKGRAKMK
jgi:hypothetical protein